MRLAKRAGCKVSEKQLDSSPYSWITPENWEEMASDPVLQNPRDTFKVREYKAPVDREVTQISQDSTGYTVDQQKFDYSMSAGSTNNACNVNEQVEFVEENKKRVDILTSILEGMKELRIIETDCANNMMQEIMHKMNGMKIDQSVDESLDETIRQYMAMNLADGLLYGPVGTFDAEEFDTVEDYQAQYFALCQ